MEEGREVREGKREERRDRKGEWPLSLKERKIALGFWPKQLER